VNALRGKETTKIDQAGVPEIKKIPRNAPGNISELFLSQLLCHFLSFRLP